MKRITTDEFLAQGETLTIVDVRSPKEFEEGHIPGAVNMPIFDNDERAVVGTLYKQKGKDEAVIKGLEIVGPKMASFAIEAKKMAVDGRILVHCWRGGMRSESMAWLFERVGLDVDILIGGYKAYRSFCLEHMHGLTNIVILKGCTGSGKTEILHQLASRGEQMVDLEGLANHRGSSFGGIEQGGQPSTQQFQNNLYEVLRPFTSDKCIWVEGESKSIGRVYIPDTFWDVMREARVVEIEVPFDDRVQFLVEGYAQHNAEDMVAAIRRLQKRLGGGRMNDAIALYEDGDFVGTAALLLQYYDKGYRHSDSSYVSKTETVVADDCDASKNAELLLAYMNA